MRCINMVHSMYYYEFNMYSDLRNSCNLKIERSRTISRVGERAQTWVMYSYDGCGKFRIKIITCFICNISFKEPLLLNHICVIYTCVYTYYRRFVGIRNA